MLKTGVFILVMLCSSLCMAQNDSIMKSSTQKFNLKLSYNSSLIYPGISAGIEFSAKKPDIGRTKNHSGYKFYTRYRFITGSLNWYHHPYFHDNVYLTAEWVMRRTNSRGFISEFSAGPGISRTFLGGTTYRVNNSGDISVVKLAGYYYALITIGGGLGIDYYEKKQLPFSAVVKMNLISMFPYNSTVYVRPVVELGIRYMPSKIKSKQKKK